MSLPIVPPAANANAAANNISNSSKQQSAKLGERYKMNTIAVSLENNNTTVLPNIELIAKQIRFPSAHIAHYLCLVLNTTKKASSSTNSQVTLRGTFTQQKVQAALYKLIGKWLICDECHLPELTIGCTESGVITRSCKACGHEQEIPTGAIPKTSSSSKASKNSSKKSKPSSGAALSSIDETFAQFIAENPPPLNKDDENDMKLFAIANGGFNGNSFVFQNF